VRYQGGGNRERRVGDMRQGALCHGSKGGAVASGKRVGIEWHLVFQFLVSVSSVADA